MAGSTCSVAYLADGLAWRGHRVYVWPAAGNPDLIEEYFGALIGQPA